MSFFLGVKDGRGVGVVGRCASKGSIPYFSYMKAKTEGRRRFVLFVSALAWVCFSSLCYVLK